MCATCRELLAGNVMDPEPDAVIRPKLGEREVEIIVAWLIHETKYAAARELHIALSTVKTTIQRARDKYERAGRPAPTQVALLIRLVQDGVIEPAVLTRLDPESRSR